jgi:voltage-gated potassium channel
MKQESDKGAGHTSTFSILKQRLSILRQVDSWLETPMIILSAVWLGLMVSEYAWGTGRTTERLTTAIWIIFILDFLLRFTIAPRKVRYLRTNWLTVISLLLPALRIFRAARVFRALARLRGLQLVRILGSVNRGMKALGKTMRRRGFGYLLGVTAIVTIVGAAGMFNFEKSPPEGSGFKDIYAALWWTAMIMTGMGTDYWPRTTEGRALALLLSIYAFSVFGYFTGVIATYFISRDAEESDSEVLGKKDLEKLHSELAALREEIKSQRLEQ